MLPLALLTIAGCGWFSPGTPAAPQVPMVVARLPLPARFDAPLGSVPGPPRGKIQSLACRDPETARALFAHVRADPVSAGLWLDGSCHSEAFVAAALEEVKGDPESPLWAALVGVTDPAVASRIVAEAPLSFAILYLERHRGPFHPRLVAVSGELFRSRREALGAYVLLALSSVDDPALEPALLALHAEVPREHRDAVGVALWRGRSPEAVRIHRAACRRNGGNDQRCVQTPLDRFEAIAVGEADAPLDGLFERFPDHRGALVQSLTRCVVDDTPNARSCALALARGDRDAARQAVAGDPALSDIDSALRSDRALADRLQAMGVVLPPGETPLLPTDALIAAGRAMAVGPAIAWPPGYDRLLYDVAAMLGEEGLDFEEIPPSESAPLFDGRHPKVILHAFDGIHRYRATVPPYDGRAYGRAIGFLNAVLAAKGSDQRVQLDASGTVAIGGPAKFLADAEDLVRFGAVFSDTGLGQ